MNENVLDLEYKLLMKEQLERELEQILYKKFLKDFRISISADADILTSSELKHEEKQEVLRIISAYLIAFDSEKPIN
jgi:hypothetical protein